MSTSYSIGDPYYYSATVTYSTLSTSEGTYIYISPGRGMTYSDLKLKKSEIGPKLDKLRRLYALAKIRKDKQQMTYLEKEINAKSK